MVSVRVRCLVEVFLWKLPEQMAKVLAWIALDTTGLPKTRDWHSSALVLADDSALRAALFLHKKWAITALIQHIERIYQRDGKVIGRETKKILDLLRAERQADVSQATFDLFVTHLRRSQQQQQQHQPEDKLQLAAFIEQEIRFASNADGKPLSTTKIFRAYNAWASKHGHTLCKSSGSLGIALRKYKGKLWEMKTKSNETKHYGISLLRSDDDE